MTSLTKTRSDVVKQVLANLGKLANDEPNAEDSASVDAVIDSVAASLSARNIYTVQDTGQPGPIDGAVDPAAFLEFCHAVAFAAAPSFNMAGDATLAALAKLAESRMELVAAPPKTRRTLQIDKGAYTTRRYGYYNGQF